MSAPGRLGRIAGASARHPFVTVGAWLVALTAIALVALGGIAGEGLFARLGGDASSWANGESSRADDLLAGEEGETVTLVLHGVDLDDADVAAIVAEAAADAAGLEGVEVVNPLALPTLPDGSRDPRVASLIADDDRGVLVPATIESDAPEGTADDVVAIWRDAAAELRDLGAEVVAGPSSTALLVDDLLATSENDLRRGETVALPIALLVMLVVFGGFLAAGMPLVGAISSILGGLGAVFGVTYLLEVDTTVLNVVTAVGLGLSIDYGLLIVSRYREEYRREPDGTGTAAHRLAAIVRTADSAGRTVTYSGLTFGIASLGLLFFEPVIVRAIGLGALSVTVVAIASALTLLPALLALAGERLVRPGALTRIPGVGRALRAFGDVAPADGFFSRLTRRIQRHPALVTLAALAALAILAAPVLSLRLANTAVDAIPRSSAQYDVVTAIREHFPDAAAPRVALVAPDEAAARAWAADAERLDDVESVGVPRQAGDAWVVPVTVDGKTGDRVVGELRADRPDAEHLVTGTDARAVDFSQSLAAGVPAAVGVIALGTIALLFLMTGSLVIPIKALLASALSLGASIGLLVVGFQWGFFAPLMGFDPDTVYGVDTLVVLLTLVFGFGLAMDYEMFILSRVADAKRAGADDAEAIARGLQQSGRIISSAALIIIVVFAGFATGDLMVIRQLGTALAFAVFLDATLVRCILVPALMTWQRRIMWWAPRWLRPVAARFALRD